MRDVIQLHCITLYHFVRNHSVSKFVPLLQLHLVMYKIRYFFMLKYFMKYFGNICVFDEIFQNAMPFCTPCSCLPHGGQGTKFGDVK